LTSYNFNRCNILLVEDNAYIRNTMEELLRSFKFARISTAENGEEAIDFLKSMHMADNPGPDIIISDLVMSPINGLLIFSTR